MADMTREEVDAKIAASEARNDGKLDALRASVDALIARMDRFELRIGEEIRELKQEMASLKKTVIITCISATLATIFGVAAFNAALLSNMRASYDSGTEAGKWRRDMELHNEENRRMLSENRQMMLENRQLMHKMGQQYEQSQQLLEALKQERAPARR
jgi:hypothetical protein